MDDQNNAAGESGLVGISFDSGPLELTPVMVREFAAVTHSDDGGEQVPHTIAAPLTSGVQEKLIGDERLGIDLARTMHTEQRIEVSHPLEVGTTYTATATVESIRKAAGGRLITFVTDVRDPGGSTVQTLRTTLLSALAEADESTGGAE
ncbi:MAG TPA: MaoC family dehydratase N-terminal domain-containing protein [Dietzia timorensis]|uniref:MaoC family dehydratase N-terminal domain-containing protein n=1 Tax=Dietzia timorensis TaxID=499555 RepID=A0A921F2R5_9ACTN|nr:(3R)-hydroxyacyl-ACP dehydratase subunit HadA [Dietzia timorensis]HJE90112.1 MaoC family dehydratase N-terminal domain-containing protein [Dietzia timorensis]